MNPVPIPDALAHRYPNFNRLVVAGPNGDLTGDGSSPAEASAVEAMVGVVQGWRTFIVHHRPTPDEIERLVGGGLVRVAFYAPQMPVHGLDVIPEIR